MVEPLAAAHWHSSAHSNERFPLRFYASAQGNETVYGHDALVIAVALFNPADGQGDRLVVSTRIMDDDGVMLGQGPRYEVQIPSESWLRRDPAAQIPAVDHDVRVAMGAIDRAVFTFPPARPMAWTAILTLSGPRPAS